MALEQYSKKPDLRVEEERHKYYLEHLAQYILLIIIFIVSLFLLFQLKSPLWKLVVISILSLFYLVFGVWHHLDEKNLSNLHVLEYLAVSAIIFVVLYSLFL